MPSLPLSIGSSVISIDHLSLEDRSCEPQMHFSAVHSALVCTFQSRNFSRGFSLTACSRSFLMVSGRESCILEILPLRNWSDGPFPPQVESDISCCQIQADCCVHLISRGMSEDSRVDLGTNVELRQELGLLVFPFVATLIPGLFRYDTPIRLAENMVIFRHFFLMQDLFFITPSQPQLGVSAVLDIIQPSLSLSIDSSAIN